MSTGHVVMVLAGVLGALLTLSAFRAADNTRPILAAARDIAPGAVLDAHSLRITRVHVDDAVFATLFGAETLRAMRGRTAVEHIAAGALLTRDAVRPIAAGQSSRAMSFPIPRSRAMGGALVVGDRIDVLGVRRNSGESGYVATDVPVLAFSSAGSGPLQGSDDASVTIAVDADAAARIASALETGSITLVRATGAAPLHPAVPFDPVAARDPGAAATSGSGAVGP